jgi:hypothetical protein
MKSLSLLFAVVALVTVGLPQRGNASDRLTSDDYLSLLRIDLRAAKAQVVVDTMELTPGEARLFWPVYREYDEALSKLNIARINLLREFAASYSTIDDVKARDFMRRTFDFQRKRLALVERAAGRIQTAISPTAGARFAQIENQMLMLIDVQLASDFPLIPRNAIPAGAPPR